MTSHEAAMLNWKMRTLHYRPVIDRLCEMAGISGITEFVSLMYYKPPNEQQDRPGGNRVWFYSPCREALNPVRFSFALDMVCPQETVIRWNGVEIDLSCVGSKDPNERWTFLLLAPDLTQEQFEELKGMCEELGKTEGERWKAVQGDDAPTFMGKI